MSPGDSWETNRSNSAELALDMMKEQIEQYELQQQESRIQISQATKEVEKYALLEEKYESREMVCGL